MYLCAFKHILCHGLVKRNELTDSRVCFVPVSCMIKHFGSNEKFLIEDVSKVKTNINRSEILIVCPEHQVSIKPTKLLAL